jgi:hypothetical protein
VRRFPLSLLALVVAGCATSWDPHAPRTVTAGPEGGKVSVEHGQRLLFRLPAGVQDWNRVEPQIRAVIPAGPQQGDTWMFTPVRSGQETLRFESGEKSVTYEISVPDSPTGLFSLIWSGPRTKTASR